MMTLPDGRIGSNRKPAIRFRLRSMFAVMTLCAVLSAIYGYFGTRSLLIIWFAIWGAFFLFAALWAFDACVLLKCWIERLFRRRPARLDHANFESDHRILAANESVETEISNQTPRLDRVPPPAH